MCFNLLAIIALLTLCAALKTKKTVLNIGDIKGHFLTDLNVLICDILNLIAGLA